MSQYILQTKIIIPAKLNFFLFLNIKLLRDFQVWVILKLFEWKLHFVKIIIWLFLLRLLLLI